LDQDIIANIDFLQIECYKGRYKTVL
jgi:hypothetical protein